MIRPVNARFMDPLHRFIYCEVSYLIKSSAVWNTIVMDKAFCKSKNGSYSNSIA